MDNLQNDLLELLQKSLPAAQVGVIKDRLIQADELEAKVKSLNKDIELNKSYTSSLFSEKRDLEKKVEELQSQVNECKLKEECLVEREKLCLQKELNWAVIERDIKLEAADRVISTMFNLTSQVFHSPVFQTEQKGMISVPTQYGGAVMQPFDMITRCEQKVPFDHAHTHGVGMSNTTGPIAK